MFLNNLNGKIDIDKLIEAHSNHLTRLCYIFLKDYHLAQDAVQEAIYKAYLKYGSFKGKSSEKTWITSIAINICKKYIRKSSYRELSFDSITLDYVSSAFSVDYDENSNSIDLLNRVYNLPYIYKQVILLHYYEDVTVKEIARVLKQKENTISVRLKRAKEMLKINLEEDDEL